MKEIGKILMIGGLLLLVIGFLVWVGGDKLKSLGILTRWFGHLPGDINIRKPNHRFYMPLTSMILLSLFLSVLIWLIQKFLK